MTWQELADAIGKMDPQDRAQPVRYVEPYDDENEGYFPELRFAREPVFVGTRGEETVFVDMGRPFLR
jgi:hypothetical protein